MSETKLTYTDWYNQSKQRAEQDRLGAINTAEVNYQKSKSEYGNKAEALRNMGLTGAGYSDYLNGQAYAQMQGAIANANAQKASTIADIDAKYMDYINQKEEAAKANYANLLSNITYNWTDSDIDNYAGAYGLSPEQVTTLKQTRLDRVKRFLDTNDYNIDTLKMLLPEGSEDYETYRKKLLNTPLDTTSFYGEDGKTLVASDEARATIDAANAEGRDTKALEEAYRKLYSIGTLVNGSSIVTLNTSKGNFKTGRQGDNFQVAYTGDGVGGETFKVQNGGKVEDANVLNVAKNVAHNQVFYYNGRLYIVNDGSVYSVVARKNGEDFDKLINLFEQNYSRG